MTRRAAIVGTSAIRVGRHQTSATDEFQNLEHEILARLVVEAIADAGADRRDVASIVLAQPRPYTRQQYFSTFMAGYLKLPCSGVVMEVLGNGLTAALAFDKAVDEVLLGRAEVALALGINMETAVSSRDHMMESMRKTGDVDFHTPGGFTPISWYAMDMMRYMHEYGATRADIAAVAVKNIRSRSRWMKCSRNAQSSNHWVCMKYRRAAMVRPVSSSPPKNTRSVLACPTHWFAAAPSTTKARTRSTTRRTI